MSHVGPDGKRTKTYDTIRFDEVRFGTCSVVGCNNRIHWQVKEYALYNVSSVQYGFDYEPPLVAADSRVDDRIFNFVTRLPIPTMKRVQERGQHEVLRWLRASLDASRVCTLSIMFWDCRAKILFCMIAGTSTNTRLPWRPRSAFREARPGVGWTRRNLLYDEARPFLRQGRTSQARSFWVGRWKTLPWSVEVRHDARQCCLLVGEVRVKWTRRSWSYASFRELLDRCALRWWPWPKNA